MYKVLRIINRFNLGGPTFNAAYLTKYLEPDYQTLLMGGVKQASEESSEFIIKDLGINYQIIPEMRRTINYLNDLKAYNIISKTIKDFKPDIVHTHAAKAGAIGRVAAHRNKVPVILHTYHGHVFHSYFNSLKSSFYINIERYLAGISTKIIAISEIQKYELSQIHKIAKSDKFEIIPLGFDLSKFNTDKEAKRLKFREYYKINDDEIAVGIIGRLAPVKNHIFFIDSIENVLKATSKKLRFIIIGDGESKFEIIEHIKNKNIPYSEFNIDKKAATITFTSWIKNIDTALPGLDIVALTSLNEGTPVSLIEAQAAGKPIISTKVGGIENVVIPCKSALLSEVQDLETFSSNLLKLIEDDKLRYEMSLYGWDFVKEKFHYTRLVADMKNLYDKLLKKS
ncbi:MAG: glycosyltransferase [Bacteroidales bacterium]|nr:glycosyltransferase [Bacteroidales bacterium]